RASPTSSTAGVTPPSCAKRSWRSATPTCAAASGSVERRVRHEQGPRARHRGVLHGGGRPEAARRPLRALWRLLLPEAVLVLSQPGLWCSRPRRRRAVHAGHAVVVHRQPLRAAAAL